MNTLNTYIHSVWVETLYCIFSPCAQEISRVQVSPVGVCNVYDFVFVESIIFAV